MANNGQRGGSGVGARAGGAGVSLRVGWPQERWAGIIILLALGLLILIRLGFRGIGVSGSVAGRVSV